MQVATVRSFNRTTTERNGALSDEFLGRKRPLGQARLLWEIGRGGVDVRELRARLGLDAGFDPGQSTLPDADVLSPPIGVLLVARLRGEPVGCGALRFYGEAVDVKRMWVSPEVRGLGLGRRLLHELEERARATGAAVVRLETNRSLREAISLYRASGYEEVAPFNDEPYAHHWFAKRL